MALVVEDIELEAIHSTFNRLEQRWNVQPIPDANVWHAYDPLPIALFLAGIRIAVNATKGLRFLDLGCGVGTKLSIMYALGFEVAGIELHEPYAKAACELMPEAKIKVGNILDIEVFDADIVYMYRPARTDDLENTVEQHVIKRLTPGTILLLPCREPVDSSLVPIGHEVWKVN